MSTDPTRNPWIGRRYHGSLADYHGWTVVEAGLQARYTGPVLVVTIADNPLMVPERQERVVLTGVRETSLIDPWPQRHFRKESNL